MKLAIYYASYLYFPAVIALAAIARRNRAAALVSGCVFIGLSLLAYARFVEPRLLLVREHDVPIERCVATNGAARIAVVADTHIGLFGNAMPVDRIVRRLKTLDIDAVLFPGDFVYFIDPEKIEETFKPFQEIDAPVYAVLGNHDIGLPGPDLTDALTTQLAIAGIEIIDDQRKMISVGGLPVELVGLSDLWADEQRVELLTTPLSRPRIAMTHNPGTVRVLRDGMYADLLIAGHTHGGQIYIPFVTCALIDFACRVQRYGLNMEERIPVFVTSGTGMTGLPMRFNMPPRIDVLNVATRACDNE